MSAPVENHYATLGVSKDADFGTIRITYRKLVLKYHPDQFELSSEREAAQAHFQSIQRAYEVLGLETSRRKYDEQHKWEDWRLANAYPSPSSVHMQRPPPPPRLVPAAGPQSRDLDRTRVEREIEERNERAQRQFEISAAEPTQQDGENTQLPAPEEENSPSKQAKLKLSSVPPAQLGIRIMNPSLDPAAAKVDIVAVHGLGAIPDITWEDSASGVNWLSEPLMLPAVTPEARILRFGYDSLWLGKEPIRTRLPTIADKLLLVLARERQDHPRRPLVFVGHCFGGLVIQRALTTANLYTETDTEEGILKSTVGVVFLGTPNRGTLAFGSRSALFAAIAAQSELYPSMEAGVLEAMELEGAAGILDVSNDFLKLSARMKLRVTCFFEQRESNLGKMVGRPDLKEFVVNEFSARLEGHRAIGLPLDHFKLNKFASPEDGNYQDVSGEVVRFYKLALEVAMARPVNRRRSSGDVEAYRRLIAKQELKLEEAAKEAALKEEEFEKRDLERLRLQEEQSAKGEAERRVKMTEDSLERLKRNMVRYGLGHRAIEAIFRQHPPPPTLKAHYPEESISEQSEWYRSTLKGVLLEAGLGEGEVDAIMHDTNDTMLINGVRTSITRMLDMWLSERTLMRYKIPYMRDPTQPSMFIIKRWVPLYEKEFLWDHTNELRNPRKSGDSTSRPTDQTRGREHSEHRRHRDRSVDSERDAILRRRRKSAEVILSPPTSDAVASRRSSSRTLRDQNFRRSISQSSNKSSAAGTGGGAGWDHYDSQQETEQFRKWRHATDEQMKGRQQRDREKRKERRRGRDREERLKDDERFSRLYGELFECLSGPHPTHPHATSVQSGLMKDGTKSPNREETPSRDKHLANQAQLVIRGTGSRVSGWAKAASGVLLQGGARGHTIRETRKDKRGEWPAPF